MTDAVRDAGQFLAGGSDSQDGSAAAHFVG